jgi:predicted transcriptional regulator
VAEIYAKVIASLKREKGRARTTQIKKIRKAEKEGSERKRQVRRMKEGATKATKGNAH